MTPEKVPAATYVVRHDGADYWWDCLLCGWTGRPRLTATTVEREAKLHATKCVEVNP